MKKIPTLFVRDFEHDHGRYVTDQVTPGCEWVFAGEGVATRKYDGTCVKVEYEEPKVALWTRREVKPGKQAPPDFQMVEVDEATGKTVGWEPASQSSFSAFLSDALMNQRFSAVQPLSPGTYELVGPKINGNPEGYERHVLVRHADAQRVTLRHPLTFDTIQADVLTFGGLGWEGIVWHHPDGRMAKIKARDFRRPA